MRDRPVLIYDGDCGFCTAAVRLIARKVRPRCDMTPWQQADLVTYGVPEERARHEALWVTPKGRAYGGAHAVAKILLSSGGGWPLLGALLTLPPIRWAAHGLYRLIADNRQYLSRRTTACTPPAPPAHRL
ncbi:thiol-disulfide oxidoreductase DCC family protein [Streptomyces flavofungini]|uniref:thiol-disulfide oxidoreductase DCC family protein n=1 Tax=Streptomyces flavofungini TaxID=68200 RepID=UPI0034DFF46E